MRRTPRLLRSFLALATCVASSSACEPELPAEPFSCDTDGTCPEGYECRSGLCVEAGTRPTVVRPYRTTWINAGEMYWFESPRGGATLVVNDGFTPGERGLYEIRIDEEGEVSPPRLLFDLAEDFPTSTAVVALDDDSYGVLALRFPNVNEDAQTLSFHRVDRDRAEGESVGSEELYSTSVPFLGGTEPAYVGAVVAGSGVEVCYVDPSEGGALHVSRIEGSEVVRDIELDLPPAVLPLSGDCLLWNAGGDLALRLGLEEPLLYRIPASAMAAEDVEGPAPISGLPVFAFEESVTSLLLSASDGEFGTAQLIVSDWSGTELEKLQLGDYPLQLEPHTALSSPGGVYFAPSSDSQDFSTLRVFSLDDGGAAQASEVARPGTDTLYSARAFEAGGKLYLAWTATHGDLMDLWISMSEAP